MRWCFAIFPGTDLGATVVNFTIPSGSTGIEIGNIILSDGVNEAEEMFILVIKITDSGGMDLVYDEAAGILLYTILDSNRKASDSKLSYLQILYLFSYKPAH